MLDTMTHTKCYSIVKRTDMKRHLIRYIGSAETDYHTTTCCGMDSDKWSEQFADNVGSCLVDNANDCTCKKCLTSFEKELREFEARQK